MGLLRSSKKASTGAPFPFGPNIALISDAAMLPFMYTSAHETYLSCMLLAFTRGSMHTHMDFPSLSLRRMGLFPELKGILAVLEMIMLQVRLCPQRKYA